MSLNHAQKCLFIIIFILIAFILFKQFNKEIEYENKRPKPLSLLENSLHSYPFQLMNIRDFSYTIYNNVCNNEEGILGLFIITSYSGDVDGRSIHRRTFSKQRLNELGFRRVFLLGQVPNTDKYASSQSAINNENDKFNDIIQGSFIEAYRNLTYKHIMGLHWASSYCKTAKFIIKMDDDIVFDIYTLRNVLRSYNKSLSNLLMGYELKNMVPIREKANKWYVTKGEYPNYTYPTFLSGWLYITNPDTAKKLVEESKTTPYFWIDDTFVTGILASKLGIRHNNINYLYTVHVENIICCLNDWKHYKYKCEYSISPNNKDFSLLMKYDELAQDCINNHCIDRPIDKSLNTSCIVIKDNKPSEDGDAIVETIQLF